VLDAGIRTFRQQGLKGLYRGMDITLMRDIPSYFTYFGNVQIQQQQQ